MKVILTKDVDKVGKTGEMKVVADGFATNYLIPQKLAVSASGGLDMPAMVPDKRDPRPGNTARVVAPVAGLVA